MKNLSQTLVLPVLLVAGAVVNVFAAPAKEPAMHEFALIFHPGPALDPAQLPRRNSAARDWALALRDQGTLTAASPLEDQGVRVSQKGLAPLGATPSIASVLVVKAKDLDSAAALAQGHPGLAFGTEIEVRPVKAVALPR
jgi:hypothetical protein